MIGLCLDVAVLAGVGCSGFCYVLGNCLGGLVEGLGVVGLLDHRVGTIHEKARRGWGHSGLEAGQMAE